MKCISCYQRKGKRACPGLEGMICTKCCGTKRGAEIMCTRVCAHLPKAETYHNQKKELKELKDRVRQIEPPEETEFSNEQVKVITMCHLAILHFYYEEGPELVDKDVHEAMELLIKNCRTRQTGLIYEQRADRAVVQALMSKLDEMINFLVKKEKMKLDEILSTLERIVEMIIISRSRGESEREYLNFIEKIFQEDVYGDYEEDEEKSLVVNPSNYRDRAKRPLIITPF